MNNRLVRSVFAANQQGIFQVSTFTSDDFFGVANSFEARFLDILAGWLFAREAPAANPTFMNIVEL